MKKTTNLELNQLIGNNVKKYRIACDLNIGELANLLGYSCSALRLIENGTRGTSISTLLKLTKIFGISLDTLVNDYETKPSLKMGTKPNKMLAISRSLPEKDLELATEIFMMLHKHKHDCKK
ncbi:MAG: helix-turn-helix domain-containing protein [Defluviitaleaceae bacterium]|nr:helix-turn-helix domain-containing protein [Defluviitaleaceae bacterium]